MSFQEIAVYIIVAGAFAYLAYRAWNNLHKKDCGKGCGCASELSKKDNLH